MKKILVLVMIVLALVALGIYIYLFTGERNVRRLAEEFLKSNDEAAVLQLSKAARKVGPKAVPILLQTLKDKRLQTPSHVINILGDMGPLAKDAVPDLLAIFEQEWPKITTSRQPDGKKVQLVLDIVKVLGKIKDSRAVAPLLKLTQVYVGYKQNHILADLVIKTFGNLGPAAKDAIPVLAERIWTTASGFVIPWDDLICEAAKQFEPSLWGRIVSECEYYAALRNTKVTLVSPADVTSFERVATDPNSSAAVTFQWQIEKQIPRATYCSVLYTDKGSNPFDFGYEEAFNVGKATRATLKLGNIRYGNIFEWGVRVWACRDSNVDCKEPSDLLESSSLLPSTCFHVATSNIRRWCMGCIRLKVNKADEKVNKADGVVVPIRKFVLPH